MSIEEWRAQWAQEAKASDEREARIKELREELGQLVLQHEIYHRKERVEDARQLSDEDFFDIWFREGKCTSPEPWLFEDTVLNRLLLPLAHELLTCLAEWRLEPETIIFTDGRTGTVKFYHFFLRDQPLPFNHTEYARRLAEETLNDPFVDSSEADSAAHVLALLERYEQRQLQLQQAA